VRPLAIVGFVVAAVLPATFTLDPAFDHDTWWHLAVGRSIRESGNVPTHDSFSQIGRSEPTPWLAYSWLYEVGLFESHRTFGDATIFWLRSLLGALSTATLLAFAVRRLGAGWQGILFGVLSAVVLMPLMKERPWHLTIAFAALTADCICRFREGEPIRRFLWLPLLFALLANLHIQFVLGWGILGIACLFPGLASRRSVIALSLACVVAAFANPYHVRLLGVIGDYATQTGPLRTVQELAPPDFASPWTWAGLALVAWAGLAAIRRRRVDWFSMAFLAVGLLLAMRMRRDGWFAVLAAAASFPLKPAEFQKARWVAGIVVAVFLGIRLADHCGLATRDPAANSHIYPVEAVKHIQMHSYPGPLFNSFDWGGYLIWALPEYPVAIDGRTNLYGSERVSRSMETWAGESGWESDPELKRAKIVIAPRYGALAGGLRERKEWRVVHEDSTAVVFVAVP